MHLRFLDKAKDKIFHTQSLEKIYDPKNNSFDLARFLLAVMVIYAHSYPLLIKNNSGDLVSRFTKNQIDAGGLAVYCFFAISGFLITQSIVKSRSYIDYLIKRFLRIMPAFFMSLCIAAFIIGPVVSNISLWEYFFQHSILEPNSPYSYILRNITFNVRGYSWGIYNVFTDNAYPLSMNGSMWTLKHEIFCYLGLIIISMLGFLKKRKLYLIYTMVFAVILILYYVYDFKLFHLSKIAFLKWDEREYINIIRLGFIFNLGSLIYIYRDKVKFNILLVMLPIILFIILLIIRPEMLKYALILLLPYLIISICIKLKFSSFSKYGDFSYGIYIYAFMIQQTLSHYFNHSLTVISFFALSFIITLVIAILSWNFIERPCMLLKNNIKNIRIINIQSEDGAK